MGIDVSKLSAAELDELIAEASKRRATLEPAVAAEPETMTNAPLPVVASDPRFWVNEAPMHGGVILRIRDPGVGWRGYYYPHSSALQMSDLLRRWSRPDSAPPVKQ